MNPIFYNWVRFFWGGEDALGEMNGRTPVYGTRRFNHGETPAPLGVGIIGRQAGRCSTRMRMEVGKTGETVAPLGVGEDAAGFVEEDAAESSFLRASGFVA